MQKSHLTLVVNRLPRAEQLPLWLAVPFGTLSLMAFMGLMLFGVALLHSFAG
ncbi:hypothetical protein [Tautonia plasticadhaerens]|uniref:Uncharacterized protein n=1 Tax=Tautonia plasticadhaerens TaxID=2527974 RepID=A0A518H261_9BACT|nr:hypothetical protein [Tautonia plasticadhaerens]QDV34932.1 hypothetical protein ElP_28290 [Tautonia plasticadhaerens]